MAADAAVETVPFFQHERGCCEVGDVDSPRGEGTRDNGEVSEDAIGATALHLGLVEGTT